MTRVQDISLSDVLAALAAGAELHRREGAVRYEKALLHLHSRAVAAFLEGPPPKALNIQFDVVDDKPVVGGQET